MRSSWFTDLAARDSWVAFAQGLAGFRINSVAYFNLDYRREQVAPDATGPRSVPSGQEWEPPTFEFPAGHTLDYGVELASVEGRSWSLTWAPPAQTHALALHDGPMIPDVLDTTRDVAVWTVSDYSWWRTIRGRSIDQVQPHIEPWQPGDDASWCPRLELLFASGVIEVLLAQGRADGAIEPAANNLVIRFTPR